MPAPLLQDPFTVNAQGRVNPGPSIDDVLGLVAEAVVKKLPLSLKPGEVRVLHNWLVTLEQGNPERVIRSL